jgi:WD40 repeat protein
VVGGIVFLSVLTGPSGLEPEDDIAVTPSSTAQTTTTVPAPGSSRALWGPPAGTWVGGFTFSSSRPDTLYGPSMAAGLLDIEPATVIVDSLPDGRLVGVASDTQRVVLISSGVPDAAATISPLPWPGPQSTPPLVSPDGTRLAMIDATGVPHVWAIGDESGVSLGDSTSTAVEAIASFSWSPDSTLLALNAFQGGYYLWDLDTNDVSRSPIPGRAIAISNTQVAVWGSNGLELRDLTGRVLRRWNDLFPSELRTVLAEGAFDPLQRYLAVRGRVGPDGDRQDGLTVLSTIGTTRRLLTTEPAQGIAWSGNGSGLYWLDSNGLQVWSADPQRAPATLVGRGGDEVFGRLRVYDPAISPVPHSALVTSTLLELHPEEDGVYVRTTDGRAFIDVDQALISIIPAGIPGFFLSVGAGDAEQPVMLTDPNRAGAARNLGTLDSFQLPVGSRLTRAVALSPETGADLSASELEATRWYLETDSGSILFGPEAGLFTTAAEGSSLSFLGETAFHVTPDGSAIQTIPTGTGIDTVVAAADLDAERILAVGVVRRTMFVMVATADGEAQIWQVPADSELLATPLFPPSPSITSWAWVVYTFPSPATGGEILVEPDPGTTGEVFAARINGPNGPVTVIMAAPLALESVCGASAGGACELGTWSGSPLGFSPDGNWLLVGNGDEFVAVSTVGRGKVVLPDLAPNGVAWVEAVGG